MPNAYNLHFNHVPHVTTSPGLGDPETAYCTEMVLEKKPISLLSPLGKTISIGGAMATSAIALRGFFQNMEQG